MKKSINRILLSIFAVLAVFSSSLTVSATDITVLPPKPDTDYFVTDLAGVLNQLTIDDVTSKNTEKLGPASEVVVLTVNSIGTSYTLEQFTDEVFRSWQIGGQNEEGILFVMEISGGNYRAKIGPGLSDKFTQETLQEILDTQVESYFSVADYNAAATSFVNSVVNIVATEDGLPDEVSKADGSSSTDTESSTTEEESSIGSVIWGIFQVILVIILILVALAIGFIVFANIRAQKIKAARRAQRSQRQRTGNPNSSERRSGQAPRRRPPPQDK